MKAYKGFDKDLKCRGFQYEIGKEYETDKAVLCVKGFHACENPLDTFRYYAPGRSRFCEVELEDVSDQMDSNDSKRVAKKIKIGAELSVLDICKAHFEYVNEHCEKKEGRVAGDEESVSVGDNAAASAGEYGSASAGNRGSASAGYGGIASCRGGKVKGGLNCAICCTEVDNYGRNVGVLAAIVDGVTIKENTWYTVKDGKWVEAE